MTAGGSTLGERWRAARPAPAGVHVDSAACSRQSHAVIEATAQHARHEAEVGGYVAAEAAAPVLDAGRAAIGALTGFAADDVVFTTGAGAALDLLLDDWRGPRTLACLPGEFGPNLLTMARHGYAVRHLPTDGAGRLDPDAAAAALAADPPGLVHLTVLGSHSGVVQPTAAVAAACRSHGVPLLVDAAQAFGQLDGVGIGAGIGADAVYTASRKWTAGPRGVGWVATRPGLLSEETLLRIGHAEANVAARVGLSVALGEYVAAGPDRIRQRLAEVGTVTRTALAGVAGWQVIERDDEPSAITTLRPPDGVDAAEVRARLIAEHRIVTTYLGVERAPGEMTRPALRVSPHVDLTDNDLDAIARALVTLS
ncbi:ergothioneine biosynthesis PLP-dependent enzyme EgtE [Mycolicibacterium grossiae]|uniref:Probable hercynylcysteine sulfoxide lyase n=1 Tax=Mycolicibacterium grossiae TaxID=1552759 RepID=A0A1E8Q4Y5_9MYCO|nr:ergothioneine biosynthesis PLP-dependent enzyme EgtE [Mycolicibacterium grossiae]OFJ53496.1 ergothioneine biosynthesis PLP-dependent enzyme EgtE [Mycolicibacterium grossiae]QEM44017.1 ergothioneine biosynthesis PLP-dependent enzyme EgtE [Mycolicibacterium grossiae]